MGANEALGPRPGRTGFDLVSARGKPIVVRLRGRQIARGKARHADTNSLSALPLTWIRRGLAWGATGITNVSTPA